MSGYRNLGHLLGVLGVYLSERHSRHRKARVLRFVFRRQRGPLSNALAKLQRRHDRRVHRRRAGQRLAWERAPLEAGALKRGRK